MKFLKEKDDMEGIKHDDGKPRMSLLSSMWLEGVTNVLNFGAKKYAAHNWRKGIARSRLLDAAFRHINAYNGGEDFDSESGLLHLYHASCCLMFASELHFTHPSLDDRYNRQALSDFVPPIKPKVDSKECFPCNGHGYIIAKDNTRETCPVCFGRGRE